MRNPNSATVPDPAQRPQFPTGSRAVGGLITARRLLESVAREGGHAESDGNGLHLTAPRGLPANLLKELRKHKSEVLALLRKQEGICYALPITFEELLAELDPVEREDAAQRRLAPALLRAFALAILDRKARERGEVPAAYTARACCSACGPVWLWPAHRFTPALACPWCANRIKGRPIPRPVPVRCGTCRHFKRTAHDHIGHCIVAEPESAAGLWDTDTRDCARWLPR